MSETGKVLRGRKAIWISKDGTTDWTLIGVGMDTLTTNLNPDVTSGKDVTGAAYVDHSGFSPENDVEYKPRLEDAIYPDVVSIINGLKKDEASTKFYKIEAILDVEVKDATGSVTATGDGFKVPVICVPQDDGGDTSAYTINVNFYECGPREAGSVSVSDKAPTFTAASGTT